MSEVIVVAAVTFIPILGSILLKILDDRFAVRERQEQLQNALQVARIAVDAAEQIGKVYNLKPKQKFNKALDHARVLAAGHGLEFTDDQLAVLIEAVVGEANRFKEELGLDG